MDAPMPRDPRRGAASPRERAEIEDALARVEDALGRDYPAVIDGERLALPSTVEARDPQDADVLLARFPSCEASHLHTALAAAHDAAEAWASTPWADRAHLLFEAAERVRRDPHSYAAWVHLESALPWETAQAEVRAAIDALEGNAREAVRRGRETAVPPARPLGPGVLFAAAERPLSLALSLATAALAAGNPLVFVPARERSTVGWLAYDLLARVGAPRGTIHFLPGPPADLARAAAVAEDARFLALPARLEVGLPPGPAGVPSLERRELTADGRAAILVGPGALAGPLRPRALFDAFLRA